MEQGEIPAFLVETHEVLRARSAIARYGVDGWMKLTGEEPSDCLLEALDAIDGEIARLEHESEETKIASNRQRQGRQ